MLAADATSIPTSSPTPIPSASSHTASPSGGATSSAAAQPSSSGSAAPATPVPQPSQSSADDSDSGASSPNGTTAPSYTVPSSLKEIEKQYTDAQAAMNSHRQVMTTSKKDSGEWKAATKKYIEQETKGVEGAYSKLLQTKEYQQAAVKAQANIKAKKSATEGLSNEENGTLQLAQKMENTIAGQDDNDYQMTLDKSNKVVTVLDDQGQPLQDDMHSLGHGVFLRRVQDNFQSQDKRFQGDSILGSTYALFGNQKFEAQGIDVSGSFNRTMQLNKDLLGFDGIADGKQNTKAAGRDSDVVSDGEWIVVAQKGDAPINNKVIKSDSSSGSGDTGGTGNNGNTGGTNGNGNSNTTPPSSNPTTPPASNPTTPPASNPTTPPTSNPTTAPSSNPTTPPTSKQTTPPASKPTTPPASNPTTSPPAAAPATLNDIIKTAKETHAKDADKGQAFNKDLTAFVNTLGTPSTDAAANPNLNDEQKQKAVSLFSQHYTNITTAPIASADINAGKTVDADVKAANVKAFGNLLNSAALYASNRPDQIVQRYADPAYAKLHYKASVDILISNPDKNIPLKDSNNKDQTAYAVKGQQLRYLDGAVGRDGFGKENDKGKFYELKAMAARVLENKFMQAADDDTRSDFTNEVDDYNNDETKNYIKQHPDLLTNADQRADVLKQATPADPDAPPAQPSPSNS